MSYPVSKSLFLSTASFTGTTFGALKEGVSPPSTNTTWGWNVGTNNPPLFCEMNWNIEVARGSTQWLALPTQSIPSQNAGASGAGNCWIAGPFNGEFISGNWNISMSVKAVTNATSHTGHFIYRIWTSPTGSGANATLVTSSFLSSSLVTIASTVTPVVSTASLLLPRINIRNEYILIQTYWSIIGAAGNVNGDTDYVLGTTSFLTTPAFFTSHAKLVSWGGRHSDI